VRRARHACCERCVVGRCGSCLSSRGRTVGVETAVCVCPSDAPGGTPSSSRRSRTRAGAFGSTPPSTASGSRSAACSRSSRRTSATRARHVWHETPPT
jgi:hypothetical protein